MAEKADGSVLIKFNADVSDANKELAKMKKDIAKTEESINAQEAKKSPLVEQADELRAKMQQARAEVKRYGDEWAAGVSGADKEQSAAQSRLQQIQVEYDKVTEKIDKIDSKLLPAYEKLDGMVEKAGKLQQEINESSKATSRMGEAVDQAGKYMDKFTSRIKKLASRVFVFTLITSALRSLKSWLWSAIQTNDEAVSAIAKLKGALLTLAQPLVEVIIPAFTMLVNVLTRVVSALAQVFAMLTGRSISSTKDAAKALNEETEALEGTGAAADDAAGSLAGFDEINQLNTEKNSGSGGASSDISPDFEFDSDLSEDRLKNILGLIEAIGSAFLAWRIGSNLGLSMKQIFGLALAIYSAVQFVKNMFDAWTNGVNWDNLLGMLLSAAGIVTGLGIAFGKTGAGIGLIVTGLSALVTGFHDAAENGWNLQNLLLSLAGIMATGIGIGVLTGSFIPALIAGVAALLLTITVAFGEGENLIAGCKQILQGFIDFFAGVFTGDFDRAIKGIGEIFGGLSGVFNAVLNAIHTMIDSFFEWLDQKTGGKLSGLLELVKGILHSCVSLIQDLLGGAVEWLQGTFEGLVTFLSGVFTGDWDKAWEGLVQIGKSAVNLLISAFESFVNFFVRALNTVISALNKISVTVPDWVPGIGGKKFGFSIPKVSEIKLPRLAEGAVIPPNREFLAVLGDQRSGTNIETPLSTMVEAFKQAMAESDSGGTYTFVVNLDGREVARNTIRHMNDMTRERGKSVVLV